MELSLPNDSSQTGQGRQPSPWGNPLGVYPDIRAKEPALALRTDPNVGMQAHHDSGPITRFKVGPELEKT